MVGNLIDVLLTVMVFVVVNDYHDAIFQIILWVLVSSFIAIPNFAL